MQSGCASQDSYPSKSIQRKEGVPVCVVHSCVCVCLTVTHFFSGRGALTVTTAAFFAAHPFPKGVTASGTERYPSPGFFHQGVPNFALTHGAVPTAPLSYCVRYPRAGGVKG